MAKIGFIGLGNMGGPMAANLVRAGNAVRGFDLAEATRAGAEQNGVHWADDGADTVADAEIVVTMLPAGRHVVSAYAALLTAAPRGALFIECSTIDVESARQAHVAAKSAGMESLDAPVSGGTGGATAGTLTFMAGGTPAAFERARPMLEAMGKRIVHCGDAGAGQAAKICNNMVLGISMIAVCEAFVLGEKLGLSHQALFDVASTSSGQCWSLNNYCPVPGPVPTSPANRDYTPGFAAALMSKDLGLAAAAATAVGADAALGRHAEQLYRDFAADNGALDFSAIIAAIRARTGIG